MGNIIPFQKITPDKLPDELLTKIESDLMKIFRNVMDQGNGEIPIFLAKQEAINQIAAKYNFTVEQANKIVREIQLRKLDK